jgi:hypothetical protein
LASLLLLAGRLRSGERDCTFQGGPLFLSDTPYYMSDTNYSIEEVPLYRKDKMEILGLILLFSVSALTSLPDLDTLTEKR